MTATPEETRLALAHRLLTAPLRHPAAAIGLALACALLAAAGTSRIHAEGSLAAMFARDNRSADALVRVLDDFDTADDLLVMASLPPSDAASAADVDRLLAFGRRLEAEVARAAETRDLTDGVFFEPDAQSKAYFEKVLVPAALFYLDDASFAAAKDRLTEPRMREQIAQDEAMMTAPGAAGAIAKGLMKDPLRLREFVGALTARLEAQRPFKGREGTDAFVSPDGRNLLVRVRGKKPPGDLDFSAALTRGVAAVAERANTGGLELRYAGSYAIAAQSARAIRSDMIGSVIGSVVTLQVLFLLAYRSPIKLFALAIGPIALGVLLGFGAYSLWTTGLTPVAAVLGGILAGMAIDYSIQYLSFYESRRGAGATPREAAEACARGITPAAFAAWATSIIGFLAVGASSVKALRDFSILGSLGLAGAFLAVVVLLPLMLMGTDRRRGTAIRSRFRFGMEPLLGWIGRHGRLLLCTSIALFVGVIGVLAFSPGEILPLESDLTAMHPRPNPALEAQHLIGQRFGMRDWLIVYLRADSPEDLVALAHRVDRRLGTDAARSAGVAGSFGLAGLLPDPRVADARVAETGAARADKVVADFQSVVGQSAFNPDAPDLQNYAKFLRVLLTQSPPTIASLLPYRRLAETLLPRSAFAGRGTALPRGDAETPPGRAVPRAEQASPGAPVREALTLVFLGGSTDERGPRDRAVEGVRALLADEPGATVTGLSVISHDTEQTVRHDLPRLMLWAVLATAAYLIFHFRNATDALLALAPTAFSLVVLLAAMRLAGQKLNMVNLVAAPLLIGIDVDYGIFLVSLARAKQLRRETAPELLTRIAPICHAVVMCAAATIAGFGSLVWTSVPAIRSLGFAVAVGIAACLFSVLFLLVPAFLRLAGGDERKEIEAISAPP
ncbi:MAG: hypothetical protein JWP03_924 [Phycisphaerales bacterium]|nr:hypothetical protein [Phycisphaerales bacterium]